MTDPRVLENARDYHAKHAAQFGLPAFSGAPSTLRITPELSAAAGRAYAKMKHDPTHPDVKAAYEAFKKEALAQYHHLSSKGVKMEPWFAEGQPYRDSNHMRQDVRENNHLWYFPTISGFGNVDVPDNPLLERTGIVNNGYDQTYNDLFRAVHDYYGHALHGHQFGPIGEQRAWAEHARMFSPLARRAMTSETHGQNSWVNFGPQTWKYDESGEPIPDYDPRYAKTSGEVHSHATHPGTPLPKRPYAAQKTGILPEDVYPEKLARNAINVTGAGRGRREAIRTWWSGLSHEEKQDHLYPRAGETPEQHKARVTGAINSAATPTVQQYEPGLAPPIKPPLKTPIEVKDPVDPYKRGQVFDQISNLVQGEKAKKRTVGIWEPPAAPKMRTPAPLPGQPGQPRIKLSRLDGNALIDAIHHSPTDATSRDAFTDYLQESGIPGSHIVQAHTQRMLAGEKDIPSFMSARGRQMSPIIPLGPKRGKFLGKTTESPDADATRTRIHSDERVERGTPWIQVFRHPGWPGRVGLGIYHPHTEKPNGLVSLAHVDSWDQLLPLIADLPLHAQKSVVSHAAKALPKPRIKLDRLHGGLGDKKSWKDFPIAAVKAGMKVEREHTDDPRIAVEIVVDHLTEDPKYYTKLDKAKLSRKPNELPDDVRHLTEHSSPVYSLAHLHDLMQDFPRSVQKKFLGAASAAGVPKHHDKTKLARMRAPAGGMVVNNMFAQGGQFTAKAFKRIRDVAAKVFGAHVKLARPDEAPPVMSKPAILAGETPQSTLTLGQLKRIEDTHGLPPEQRLSPHVKGTTDDQPFTANVDHIASFFHNLGTHRLSASSLRAVLADPKRYPEEKLTHLVSHLGHELKDFRGASKTQGNSWYGEKVNVLDRALHRVFASGPSDPHWGTLDGHGELVGKHDAPEHHPSTVLFKALVAATSASQTPVKNLLTAYRIWKAGQKVSPDDPVAGFPLYNHQAQQEWIDKLNKANGGRVPLPPKDVEGKARWYAKYVHPWRAQLKTPQGIVGVSSVPAQVLMHKDTTHPHHGLLVRAQVHGKWVNNAKARAAARKTTATLYNVDLPRHDQHGNYIPKGWTVRGKGVADQIEKLQALVKHFRAPGKTTLQTYKDAARYLLTDHPDAEINALSKASGGRIPDARRHRADTFLSPNEMVPGSFMFGPKFGPFMLNLHMNHPETEGPFGAHLTADKWWTRLWNRYVGRLVTGGEINESPHGAVERVAMREAAQRAAQIAGVKSVAELQADLWYYEQALWRMFGGEKMESYDFAHGAEAMLHVHEGKPIKLARTPSWLPEGWIAPDGTFHQLERGQTHQKLAVKLLGNESARQSDAHAAGYAHVGYSISTPASGGEHSLHIYHPDAKFTREQMQTFKRLAADHGVTTASVDGAGKSRPIRLARDSNRDPMIRALSAVPGYEPSDTLPSLAFADHLDDTGTPGQHIVREAAGDRWGLHRGWVSSFNPTWMDSEAPISKPEEDYPEWTVSMEGGVGEHRAAIKVNHWVQTRGAGQVRTVSHITPVKSVAHVQHLLSDFPPKVIRRFTAAARSHRLPETHDPEKLARDSNRDPMIDAITSKDGSEEDDTLPSLMFADHLEDTSTPGAHVVREAAGDRWGINRGIEGDPLGYRASGKYGAEGDPNEMSWWLESLRDNTDKRLALSTNHSTAPPAGHQLSHKAVSHVTLVKSIAHLHHLMSDFPVEHQDKALAAARAHGLPETHDDSV